jgi:hypothetical protein
VSTAQDGASQNGRPAQTDNASRSEELLARRLQRLNALEPAKADKLTDILATAETDGLDQRMSVRLGRERAGLEKISQISNLTATVSYERPRIGPPRSRCRFDCLGNPMFDQITFVKRS